MISGIYYQYIFLFVVSFFSIFCVSKYNKYGEENVYENKYQSLVLALVLAVFIGFRPIHKVFVDTVGYAAYYNHILGKPFEFSSNVENLIFDNLTKFLASCGFSHSVYFLLLALIYFVCRQISCQKMFPNNSWAAYLVFLGAFLTFSSSVNGIKAGIAASIFACAIAYRESKQFAILLLAISWGFHHSMHTCVLAFLTVSLYKNTRFYSWFWAFCLIMAIAHVSFFQTLFTGFTDEKSVGYLIGTGGWRTGMRYDFVIYSAMPILLGWYYKFVRKIDDEKYEFVLNLYMLLNGLWMLCMYAAFTNRIAALSWALYPIVLIYPFFSDEIELENKNRTFSIVMLLHLAFTLFMTMVYYA